MKKKLLILLPLAVSSYLLTACTTPKVSDPAPEKTSAEEDVLGAKTENVLESLDQELEELNLEEDF